MDTIRQAVADMADAVTGHSSTSPPPQRTIISHRELAEAEDEFSNPSVAGSERRGNDDSGLEAVGTVIMDAADALFERAASATPTAGTQKTPAGAIKKAKGRPKSRTSTPAPASNKSAPKSPKSPKSPRSSAPKSPKPAPAGPAKPEASAKPSGRPAKSKIEWAGETGPDNAVTINDEQQWEISDIVGQEGDTLLVKWKGWKGVWEEDHAVIAESAPELVKAWEAKVEGTGKEVAKKRGRKAGPGKAAGKGGEMTARKAASKAAGGKGRAKKVVPKKGAKVSTEEPKKATATKPPKKSAASAKAKKSAPAASPKKPAGATTTASSKKAAAAATPTPEKTAAPPRKSAPSPKTTAPSPKKATASAKKPGAAGPRRTMTSPAKKAKKTAGSTTGAGVAKKRGRPATTKATYAVGA